jgi:hypothetical protein
MKVATCDIVAQAIDPAETDAICWHIQHQQAYGPDRICQ